MKRIIILAGVLALTACASFSGGKESETAVRSNEDGSFLLTSLGDSALPKGKCGMILWTLDANRPTPILRYISGETATIAVNGTPVVLSLAETAGGGSYGVFERQVFIGGAGYDATVDVDFGLGFDGGTYLQRGLITVKSENGWRISAPTAGIAGCRG